jgi:hypothetical protein
VVVKNWFCVEEGTWSLRLMVGERCECIKRWRLLDRYRQHLSSRLVSNFAVLGRKWACRTQVIDVDMFLALAEKKGEAEEFLAGLVGLPSTRLTEYFICFDRQTAFEGTFSSSKAALK